MAIAGTVGQTLKPAALFLWCAYFIDVGAADDSVIEIMKCLALFKADRDVVEVDYDEHSAKVFRANLRQHICDRGLAL